MDGQSEYVTRCMHVLARLAPDLYAPSVLVSKISASELSRKFIKSAPSVGYLHTCRHTSEIYCIHVKIQFPFVLQKGGCKKKKMRLCPPSPPSLPINILTGCACKSLLCSPTTRGNYWAPGLFSMIFFFFVPFCSLHFREFCSYKKKIGTLRQWVIFWCFELLMSPPDWYIFFFCPPPKNLLGPSNSQFSLCVCDRHNFLPIDQLGVNALYSTCTVLHTTFSGAEESV